MKNEPIYVIIEMSCGDSVVNGYAVCELPDKLTYDYGAANEIVQFIPKIVYQRRCNAAYVTPVSLATCRRRCRSWIARRKKKAT